MVEALKSNIAADIVPREAKSGRWGIRLMFAGPLRNLPGAFAPRKGVIP